MARFIERLRSDPELIAAFDRVKERAVNDPAVLEYVASVWRDLKHMIRADLADDDSAIVGHIEQALRDIGARIAADPALRASLNEHLLSAAGELAANLRGGVTTHIAQTVKISHWPPRPLPATCGLGRPALRYLSRPAASGGPAVRSAIA